MIREATTVAAEGAGVLASRVNTLAERLGWRVLPASRAAVVVLDGSLDKLTAKIKEHADAATVVLLPPAAQARRLEALEAGADLLLGPEVGELELAARVALLGAASDGASREEERRLFQAVVDALPLSLHAIDRDFRVVVWNRSREEGAFGRPRREALHADLFDVIGRDDALRGEYEEVFDSGRARVNEVEGGGGDSPRIFRVEKVPMRLDADEAVTHVITIGHDVTEERLVERAMAQTEKMAAIGRLAAGIAHEINNPLATIAGCAEAMRSRLADELSDRARSELAEDAQVIEEEAYRCKSILQNVLDFSRSTPETRTVCETGEVARRAARLLRHNPKFKSLELEVQVEDACPAVYANEDHIVQVLLALLVNAADAVAPTGRIVVRAGLGADGHARLSVADDGPGVPPELKDRIFEPFFTTKPPGQGTGLGLAVAYGLVQAHGGEIHMTSELGHGTRFDVVLPRAAAVAAEVTR